MNTDILRKAVELADGWGLDEDPDDGWYMYLQITTDLGNKYNVLGCQIEDPFQPALDAIAAQLVRQVDALDGVQFDSKGNGEIVWDFRPEMARVAAEQKGPDRTLNTIVAIVESKVLEKEESNSPDLDSPLYEHFIDGKRRVRKSKVLETDDV